jgi:hypothetical protein
MSAPVQKFLRKVIWGPLWTEWQNSGVTSLSLKAWLGNLGPAFIPKARVRRYQHAVSRNGLVLLLDSRAAAHLGEDASSAASAGQQPAPAQIRLAIWHRAVLPGDPAEPYGILVVVNEGFAQSARADEPRPYLALLACSEHPSAALLLDLGAGRILSFTAS